MTYPIVTIKMLEDLGACNSQRFHFSELFPSGSVEVTPDNLRKYGPDFELGWLATHFFSDEGEQFEDRVRETLKHDDTVHLLGAPSENCPRCKSINAAQIEVLIELWVIPAAAAAAERLAEVRTSVDPQSDPQPAPSLLESGNEGANS